MNYATPHHEIPSIRHYAKIFHVNPSTVSRAFQLLEREAIIYPYRTKGYYVSMDIGNKRKEFAEEHAKKLVIALKKIGYSNMDIEDMVKNNLARKETNYART